MALLVRARQLIDGVGGDPVRDGLVVADGDRIVYAGPATGFGWDAGDHQVMQLEGTMLPGLIDTHVHFSCSASVNSLQDLLEES